MKKQIITKSFSEEDLINFVKDVLCCPKQWEGICDSGIFEFKIKANSNKVQQEILNWLNTSERLWNITMTRVEKKPMKAWRKKMKRAMIESPFAAAGPTGLKMNEEYLKACVFDSLSRGEAPFASHGFYTYYLKDTEPQERAQGMACGKAWAENADIIAFYVDQGMSPGMLNMLEWLLDYQDIAFFKIEIRRLSDNPTEKG